MLIHGRRRHYTAEVYQICLALGGLLSPQNLHRFLIYTALSSSITTSFRMRYDVLFHVDHQNCTNSPAEQNHKLIKFNKKTKREKESNKKYIVIISNLRDIIRRILTHI